MAQILNGVEVVEALHEQIVSEVELLKSRGVQPTLAIVRLGERLDDISYERGACKRAQGLGVAIRSSVLPEDATTNDLVQTIESLNSDSSVHGVLMFHPFPRQIDEERVRDTLMPAKDVDGSTHLSLAGVFTDSSIGYAPCTAQACMEILKHYAIELKGKKVVVIGRSLVVGKPVAMMLLAEHATVTIAHSQTRDLPNLVKEADLVVACVGRAQMIDSRYLSPDQVVIDVGINFTDDGSPVGDVAFEEAREVVGALSPVPGGVGSVTTSVLMKHVVQAATFLSSE